MQKLYCYLDETGQDAKSEFFIVVAVVTEKERESIRKKLEAVERWTGTNRKKWHKVRHENRIRYLNSLLEQKIAAGEVYAASYRKPIPFFFPLIDILEKAIKHSARGEYRASIYVDGIDRYKAKELTNALRTRDISLRIVKSRRDESEPLIRLADMWAGCIRSALLGRKDAQDIVEQAKKEGYLGDLEES
jgi:hypothetical protein